MIDKVNDILIDEERKNGLLPEYGKKINPTALNNYLAIFTTLDDRITIADQSIGKTNNRYTAENSFLEAICFLVAIACVPISTLLNKKTSSGV